MNEPERFDLVYDIAETLLKNGAEVQRVEATITHVAKAFQLENFDSYVSIHGVFLTYQYNDITAKARVRDTPISPTSLGRIDAINTLSRHITEGKIQPEEAKKRLAAIKTQTFSSRPLKLLAYILGSASFCYIFGGSLLDACGALILGGISAVYTLYVLPKLQLSPIIVSITSSFLISICASLLVLLFPQMNVMSLITGGIVALLPGVAISNGIRALFDEDYQTGWTQILYALITAMSISIGVGTGILFINYVLGVQI